MKKAVFGLARNQDQTERIVDHLQASGFSVEVISVLMQDRAGAMTKKKGQMGTEKHTKAPEGAAAGAVTGGIIGGTLGLLAGIGSLAIPGLGPFIAAGPIMAALAGSAVGGSAGLLIGALAGLGIPEYEAKKYENSLKEGKILICVETQNSSEIDKAKEIMKKEGAEDISATREKAMR